MTIEGRLHPSGPAAGSQSGAVSSSGLPIKLLLSARLDIVSVAGMRHTYQAGPCLVSSIDLVHMTDFVASAEASITATEEMGGMC
jgi:hypothetical protein